MLELPESITLARQITEALVGKTVTSVLAASSTHKFAWYYGDPVDYPGRLLNNEILSARGLGMFVEVRLSESTVLFCDGINLRLHPPAGPIPKKHQLLLGLNDETYLSVTVSMYGGIYCWENGIDFDNAYYTIATEKPSPLTEAFDEDYFDQLLAPDEVQKLSLKAALATEQRIPGLGNGCLQDILWQAKLHPKRKTNTLSGEDVHRLYASLKQTLAEMTRLGGRSTEKDLFGQPGGYPVVMCAANKGQPCPQCGGIIQKESFMGGSVYVCLSCQPMA